MNEWKNLNELSAYQQLLKAGRVDLTKVMAGNEGSERVQQYQAPMAAGLKYVYAAKQVDADILKNLCALAEEAWQQCTGGRERQACLLYRTAGKNCHICKKSPQR